MNDLEKAKEISDIYMPDTGFTKEDLYYAAMEMAQWKDEQYKNLIKERIDNCALTDAYEGVQYETYIALFKDLFNEEP